MTANRSQSRVVRAARGTDLTCKGWQEAALGFTPAEAVWSATAGGAAALRRTDVGVHLAYRPGVAVVSDVVVAGILVGSTEPRSVQ